MIDLKKGLIEDITSNQPNGKDNLLNDKQNEEAKTSPWTDRTEDILALLLFTGIRVRW